MMRKLLTSFALLAGLLLGAGCGQTGRLYLPEPEAPPAPERTAPAPAPEGEEKQAASPAGGETP